MHACMLASTPSVLQHHNSMQIAMIHVGSAFTMLIGRFTEAIIYIKGCSSCLSAKAV